MTGYFRLNNKSWWQVHHLYFFGLSNRHERRFIDVYFFAECTSVANLQIMLLN